MQGHKVECSWFSQVTMHMVRHGTASSRGQYLTESYKWLWQSDELRGRAEA
jgi:hypothetical protein